MAWEDMAAKLHRENQELRSLVQWLDEKMDETVICLLQGGDGLMTARWVALDRQQLAKKLDAINTHTPRGT